MNWICEDCNKSYSVFTERFYNSCKACVVIKSEKQANERYEYRVKRVKDFITIFKADNEKFYKTIAVLALINGIEFDETNNNAISVRCNNFN